MRSRRVHVVGDGANTRLRLTGDWEHDPLSIPGELVSRARSHGCSWTSIGQVLGTTRQAAWERFAGER